MKLSSPRSYKYLVSRKKEHYANKVKCSALKPTQNGCGEGSKSKVLLGLKDENDLKCDYEQKSVVISKKKQKVSKLRNNADVSKSAYVLKDVQPDVNKPADSDLEKEGGEDGVGYDASDKSEKTKSCMDSIGSWINDLFTAPVKRSASCPRSVSKPSAENLMDEDSEYFKSINSLKEQFKEKLKYETTITLKNKPLVLNFDKASGNEKKLRKKTKLLSVRAPPETLNKDKEPKLDEEPVPVQTTGEVLRQNADIFTPQSPNNLTLGDSNLIKAKKQGNKKNRFESGGLEEYVLPTPAELSKRLLLNVSDIDNKCVQVYKNTHISLQESQHYRKNKSYQTSARCYTTNANPTEGSHSGYVKGTKSERRRNIHLQKTGSTDGFRGKTPLKKNFLESKKSSRNKLLTGTVSEFSTEPSTLVKSKSPKSLPNAQAELMKNNATSNSDELVKLLMKKIKVNYRVQPSKKKSTSLAPITNNKNRFMQSATNSLVISVMAKKENENHLKTAAPVENKLVKAEPETKPGFPGKDWSMRYADNNLRFDIRKNCTPPKFNKSSYLAEEEKVEGGDCILDKSSKSFYDDTLKGNLSFSNEKHNKRQDVRNMLSKLDARANAFNVLKAKQKINKKKAKIIQDSLKNAEPKEFLNVRYSKDHHDSMKSNSKSDSDNVDKETDDRSNKNENEPTSNAGCLSTELALIESNLPLVPEKPKDLLDCQPAEAEKTQSAAPLDEEPEFNVLDCLHYEEKLSNVKTGPPKNKTYKDRLYKTKSLQYIKGESPKSLLGPLTVNNNETQQTKDFEPTISSPVKALGVPLLNRRYSSNSLHDPHQSKFKNATFNHMPGKTAFLGNNLKESDVEKSKSADKRKERNGKTAHSENSSHDKEFGYEKFKKSGPGREKDKFFS